MLASYTQPSEHTPGSGMGRAPCCEKVGLKKGRWTAEEDNLLIKYVRANGEGSWRSLPKNAGLLRCGKSCRLRWINYLRGDLKRGNISAEEENTIVKLHASFGNRWSLIASHLPGRTDNEIKNYWNSHLSRKIYSFPKVTDTAAETLQDAEVISKDTPNIAAPAPPKRKSGKTSRWAMKKHKSYTQNQQVIDTQTPKQNSVTDQQNIEAAVPPPPTPTLEREALSNFVGLQAEVEEIGEGRVEVKGASNNEKGIDGVKQSDGDDILGLCQLEDINEGSGALSFSDMLLESCLDETCGVLSISEERERNDVVGVGEESERQKSDACPMKLSSNEDPKSTVNLSSRGEWNSSSSMALDSDEKWDWESVIEFNNNESIDQSSAYKKNIWDGKENLLTWLWEDDDWESDWMKLGETDLQMQNDMVAWFLS